MKRTLKIIAPVIIALFALLLTTSCTKDEELPVDTGEIKILSYTASDTVLQAWMDTATIVMQASGLNIDYEWSCNHGTIHGGGDTVRYMAGECCVGLNTITCRVFNDSSSISRDMNIRITSYFFPK
jgi:hypothetical protein